MAAAPSYQKAEWRLAWVKDNDGKLARLVVGVFPLGEHYPNRPIPLEDDQTPFGKTRRFLSRAEYRFAERVTEMHLDHTGLSEKNGLIVISDQRSVAKFLDGSRYMREATQTQPAQGVTVGGIWDKLDHAKKEPKPKDSSELYRLREALGMLGFARNVKFDRPFLSQEVSERGYALFADEHALTGVPAILQSAAEREINQHVNETGTRLKRSRIQHIELTTEEADRITRHFAPKNSKIER